MEEKKSGIDIGGGVGPGAAVGDHATVTATNIAGRDIYFNVPRPTPPQKPQLLVGRSSESKKLEKLLIENKTEHITVLGGPRGVGKTTLAALVVNNLLYQFPDCLWADMAEYRQEPLSLLRRFIRQLGQSADGLDQPDAAASFLKGILFNLRVVLVLDNVERLEELKYFRDLVNKTQSSVLIITSRADIGSQISSEYLSLDPLKEKDALSLFQKLSGLPPEKHYQAFQKIIQFCHRIPGLLCPIASQIRVEGVKGLEKWVSHAREEPSELPIPDATLIFRSVYNNLSAELKRILRIAVILAPAKLQIHMLAPLFHELGEQHMKAKLDELATLRLLRETVPDVYEPDFLLRTNASLLTQPDGEYENLYAMCHDLYIARLHEISATRDEYATLHALREAKILFGKAVADKQWEIVRRYVEAAGERQRSRFSIQGKHEGLNITYAFEADPFPLISISIQGINLVKVIAPGGIGKSISIKNSRMFFVNLNGCKLDTLKILSSSAGNIELNGAIIKNLKCLDSTVSNIQLKGAILESVQIKGSQISGWDLEGAKVETMNFVNSTGSDLNLSNAQLNSMRLDHSHVFEARLAGATWAHFRSRVGVLTTPDDFPHDRPIKQVFNQIYDAIDSRGQTSAEDKEDLKADLRELQDMIIRASNRGAEVDEGFVRRRFRNIGRLEPDILNMFVAMAGDALTRYGLPIRQIAEKAQEDLGL